MGKAPPEPGRVPGPSGNPAMSRSLSRLQALLLGVLVLLGLALGATGLFAVGNRQWLWSDTFHVRAGFTQIRGVEVGTRVRVQGIDAGEVEQVLPPGQPGEEVILRIRLDGRLRSLVRSDACARIIGEGMVGGKVVEIDPGSPAAEPVPPDAVIASRPTTELADVLGQVNHTLEGIREGNGTISKLLKDGEAYAELTGALRDTRKAVGESRQAIASFKQDTDAIKRLPVVRSYVEDPYATLVRPNAERNRKVFAEADLFEPGRAVLTSAGRQRLDEIAPWLNGLKPKGSGVVVVAYADPKDADPAYALTVTRQQSEAVADYLKEAHSVHKLGWFSSRKVTPLGQGVNPPPVPEKESLPPARVEVLVFVPQA
jgi:phospholipid/cholesterol/gamma-HCH transport system substrate-binding protein